MRNILFLIGVSAILAGCLSTPLTEPPPMTNPPTTDLASFFWPDSNATYTYQSATGGDVITVSKGGAIMDRDQNSDSTTTLTVSLASGSVSLNGLSSADLLGLDPTLSVVTDTFPSPSTQPIRINSIGSLGTTLYVATDTAIYKYFSNGDSLCWVSHAPGPNLRLYSGMGGGAGSQQLYAVEMGGTHVWSTGGFPIKWTCPASASSPISAFTPDGGGGPNNVQYWIASGNQLYRYSSNDGYVAILPAFSDSIRAMEDEGDLVVGLSSGSIFDVHSDDGCDSLGTVPSVTAIANGYIGTTQGLYAGFPYHHGVEYLKLRDGPVSTLLGWNLGFGGSGVYVGLSNDSVYSFNGSAELDFGAAAQVPVTQFASIGAYQLYALAGSQLFEYKSQWSLHAQNVPKVAKWSPGAFTLLKNNDSLWLAAYVESFASTNVRGFAYSASLVLSEGSVQLDGIQYPHVIAVRYTGYANAIADRMDVPEYLIYFERGHGPIRIERTENGQTAVTRLVP